MNRIYKVIYSKARQCSIVVSEFAKSSHKNSRKGASHTGTPALARILAAALVAGAMTWGGVPEVSWAECDTTVNENTVTNTDKTITDINANITGKGNKVIDSSNAEIVGDTNTVTNEVKDEKGNVVARVRSDDARIVGSNNAISGSRNQQVIGDNNQIIGRDDGTVSAGREENVSDLTIGRSNFIRSTDTYRNKWDSLKVIGNNNRADMEIDSAGGPAAGIVIGDNQNIDNIQDSIVIGSLSPSEQSDKIVLDESLKDDDEDKYTDKYSVGSNSIVVGYHATSSKDASIVIGNRSKVSRNFQTVTGLRSTIEGNYYNGLNYLDGQSGNFASIYGSFNKIEDATGEGDMDGVGNSINGSMNVTSNARGTMIMGVGNTVTHSKGEFILPKDDDSKKGTGDWLEAGMWSAGDYALGRDLNNDPNLTYPAAQTYAVMRDAWQHYMETSGGAVSVLGNSNTSDYAIRSQILGTNNMLKGAEDTISSYNTISGFSNTGENVKRTAIVGTGNTLKNSEDNVVIGDYHNLENGKHNVILGSMASEEKAVKKTAKAAWAATDDNPDGTYTYTVNEQVALKPNTKDIENAVMVGYNTDVTQNGGVALGSDSVASTEAGKTGYDAQGKKHNNSDTDYSAWVSTDAAVSVGRAEETDKEGKVTAPAITRQITNVAAGTQDTDAVNVAQLKSALSGAKDSNDTLKPNTNALTLNGNTLSMNVEDTAGHKVSGSVNLSQLAQTVDTNTTYKLTGKENKDNTTTITLKDNNSMENTVTVATKDTRNTVKAGENVTLDTKDNADGSHEYTVNVKADGKVEAGSTKIVSGDTVYNETRVKQDGTYVKVSNTAGENLSALDNQVTSNTQNINYLNGRVGELGDRINKVGAGAAALAALHPLDYDPEDKWDFAAGVGNYRNATAAAVGLFYRPNERTMFNLGWTMGDDRNMVNGGFSLKFGKSNKYIKYSKAEMASVIDKQSREIAELKARDVQNAKDKAEMKADNAEMKAEIEALKKQVEALAAKK